MVEEGHRGGRRVMLRELSECFFGMEGGYGGVWDMIEGCGRCG